MTSSKLPRSFYRNPDTLFVARALLGKILRTSIDGATSGGIIVETEAYTGPEDRASHAHAGRRTPRNEPMYGAGGIAYVYLCYGIHHLFNIVTGEEGIPKAILVRAIEPVENIEAMLSRRGFDAVRHALTAGPGAASAALGITRSHTGVSLTGETIWVEDAPPVDPEIIEARSRVGVAYAGEDALLPYRFSIRGNRWVSRAKGLMSLIR